MQQAEADNQREYTAGLLDVIEHVLYLERV